MSVCSNIVEFAQNHLPLLHKFVPESSALIAPLQHEQAPVTDSSSQSPPASCNHMFGKNPEQVILASALVKVPFAFWESGV
ncbi:hypothetical protein ACLKA7_001034 [Drosophila subpalustris]